LNNEKNERRRHKRSQFPATAKVVLAGKESQAQLLDFSLKGARIEHDGSWQVSPGQTCELYVEIHPMAEIAVQATIARIEGRQLALQASEPAQVVWHN